MPSPETLSISDAADAKGCVYSTVWRAVQSGALNVAEDTPNREVLLDDAWNAWQPETTGKDAEGAGSVTRTLSMAEEDEELLRTLGGGGYGAYSSGLRRVVSYYRENALGK